jgi:hypothetical protein
MRQSKKIIQQFAPWTTHARSRLFWTSLSNMRLCGAVAPLRRCSGDLFLVYFWVETMPGSGCMCRVKLIPLLEVTSLPACWNANIIFAS